MSKTFLLFNLIIFLSLLSLLNTQILIPRCNICRRCTYCSSDVMYDCQIDEIYSDLLSKYPSIGSAFPVTITKNVKINVTVYFFQFSNNKNITIQIIPKNNATSNSNTNKVQTSNSNSIKTSTNVNASLSSSTTQSSSSSSSSSSNSNSVISQPTWTALTNASQIILQYVIRHFYLSTSSVISSLTQEIKMDTYTAVVKSSDSNIKMTVAINPNDFSLKVISISFLSGSLSDSQTNTKPLSQNPSNSNPSTSTQTSPQKVGITIGRGISITATLQQLLDYLYISYNALANFQLDSYSTSDNINYNLTLSNRQQPNIKYNMQVLVLIPVSGNLRGMGLPSKTFQILSYSLINTATSSSYTRITNQAQLNADPYAQLVINQVQNQIIKPLSLQNLALVNISSSVPFYVLYYEMETKVFQFLLSYDVLTKQIRILQENISTKNNTQLTSNKSNSVTTNLVNTKEPVLTQIKQVNSNSATSAIPTNTVPTIANQNINSVPSSISPTPLPYPPTLVQVPYVQVKSIQTSTPLISSQSSSSSSSLSLPQQLNYINFRVDSVFLKASSAINSMYPFNSSNIIKVSVVTLSNTVNQYNISLTFNLPSGKFLQFLANYNSATNSVTFSNFTYTPQTILTPNLFQAFPLSDLSQNSVIMSLISFIFMTYPQYFSSAISSIQQVLTYPPYFNITYNNSVYGNMRFDCQYNYFTKTPKIINYFITQNNNSSSTYNSNQSSIATNLSTPTSSSVSSFSTYDNLPQNSDLFCIKHIKGICTQCAFRFYYDKRKQKCTPVQDWCYIFDYTNIACSECFNGYTLVAGVCQLS